MTIPLFKDKLLFEKLAYLSGILAGDGSISIRLKKKEYCIKCVGNPRDEIEFYDSVVAPLFFELFNKKVLPKIHDGGKTYGVSVYSKEIVDFFNKVVGLPIGKKNNLRVPKIFRKGTGASHFIRGMFDTDGCLCFKKKYRSFPYYPVISITSKCSEFISDIARILKDQALFPVCNLNYCTRDSRFSKGYSTISRLELNGVNNLKKWLSCIGTSHPKNLNKLEKWKEIAGGGFEFGISPSV